MLSAAKNISLPCWIVAIAFRVYAIVRQIFLSNKKSIKMKKIILVFITTIFSASLTFAFDGMKRKNILQKNFSFYPSRMSSYGKKTFLRSNNDSTKKFTKPQDMGKVFGKSIIAFTAGYGYPSWGQVVFNLDSTVRFVLQEFDNYTAIDIGPLHFRGEMGLSKFIGMGISVNYEKYGGKWTRNYFVQANNQDESFNESFTVTSFSIMPRFNLHFAVTNQIDPYCGVGAGYKSTIYKLHSDFPNASYNNIEAEGLIPIGFETTIGIRYYLSDSFGMYLETGLAKSLIQGGIALKL